MFCKFYVNGKHVNKLKNLPYLVTGSEGVGEKVSPPHLRVGKSPRPLFICV